MFRQNLQANHNGLKPKQISYRRWLIFWKRNLTYLLTYLLTYSTVQSLLTYLLTYILTYSTVQSPS